MIKITIEYMGFLTLPDIKNNSIIEIEEGQTVENLLRQWGIKEEQHRYFTPLVNDEKKPLNYTLKDKDQLFLYLPVGGG